jgi:hypothetical protein
MNLIWFSLFIYLWFYLWFYFKRCHYLKIYDVARYDYHWIMNLKLWKEVIVTWFEVLSSNLPVWTKENHKWPRSAWYAVWPTFELEDFPNTKHKNNIQQVLRRTNRLLSSIRHRPHWKRHVQQFFYCISIRYRGNVFTEPLPSNDKGISTEPLPSKDKGYTHTDTQTGGGIFLARPLRWAQVPWYMYQVS